MEGPSLLILREELASYRGQKVLEVTGNTHQPKELLKGCTLRTIETWGKVLFLVFVPPQKKKTPIVTKTHFLMFGSYRINEPRPERAPRLQLRFKNGVVYFYSCSFQFGAEAYWEGLDRRVDIMSKDWNVDHVMERMRSSMKAPLCDVLLDQSVFAGSGNIVKNEVLFNIRRHPLTPLSKIDPKDWPALAQAVRDYGWNFYHWKKKFELRRHWQVYSQSRCPLCQTKLIREHLGKFKRRTFYCVAHQTLLTRKTRLQVFPVLPITKSSVREAALDH